MFLVNKSGLGLQNPVTSAADKCTSLLCSNSKMIGAVTGKMDFSTADHIKVVKEERRYGNKYWDDVNDTKLQGNVRNQGDFEKRLGSWTSVQGTMVAGTVLTVTQFSDFMCTL